MVNLFIEYKFRLKMLIYAYYIKHVMVFVIFWKFIHIIYLFLYINFI